MKCISLVFWLLAAVYVSAQQRVSMTNDKPRVAVLLFDAGRVSDNQVFDREGVQAFVEAATQAVATVFVNLKRFTVLERAAIDKLVQEQNFQMGDLSDPNKAVTLGSLLGTEYVVQGRMQLSTSKKDKQYRSTVELHISIIDVSSGKIIAAKDVRGVSGDKKEPSPRIAYDALNDANSKIYSVIRNAFPVEGKIIKFLDDGSKKKKGKNAQARVLISCGKEIGVKEGDIFHIVQEELLTVDGKSFTRQKAVGRVKVKTLELDGIFSECWILEGELFIRNEFELSHEVKIVSAEEEKKKH